MPGLVLQPVDQAVATALAQQLSCWARTARGGIDPLVRYSGDCVSPSGATFGVWLVDAALCEQYGPLPFISGGEPITCDGAATGFTPYLIGPDDITGIDPFTCAGAPLVAIEAVIAHDTTSSVYTARLTVTAFTPGQPMTIGWDDGQSETFTPPTQPVHTYSFDDDYLVTVNYVAGGDTVLIPVTIPFSEV